VGIIVAAVRNGRQLMGVKDSLTFREGEELVLLVGRDRLVKLFPGRRPVRACTGRSFRACRRDASPGRPGDRFGFPCGCTFPLTHRLSSVASYRAALCPVSPNGRREPGSLPASTSFPLSLGFRESAPRILTSSYFSHLFRKCGPAIGRARGNPPPGEPVKGEAGGVPGEAENHPRVTPSIARIPGNDPPALPQTRVTLPRKPALV